MHVYPVIFVDGTATINAELVTDVTLKLQDWFLTPSGNGIEYSGNPAVTGSAIPTPTWATVPNFQNLSTATTINLITGYVTPTTGITLSLASGTMPVGWTFGNGTAFAYSGTGSSAPVPITVAAASTNGTVNSNQFYINGVLSVGGTTPADITAPTIPVGLQAVSVTGTTAQLRWFPSSDPSPSGANWAGMSSYGLTDTDGTGTATNVGGSPFTIAAVSTGNQSVLTFTDIGLGLTNIQTMPSVVGISGNLYVHGATGSAPGQAAGNPPNGTF